jgi:predicted transcriptional regulator
VAQHFSITARLASPVIVHSRAEIAEILADRRRALGMTCEALDAHAGFSDRYTAKLEHGDKPQGRQGFHISAMAEVWLEALGLRLVLVDADTAESIGAVPAPKRAA